MYNIRFDNVFRISNNLILIALFSFVAIFGSLLLVVAQASEHSADNNQKGLLLIGFAQDTMSNDWRIEQVKAVERELSKHANVRFIYTDAHGQTAKQILDIENLVQQGIDLLITSPRDAKALTPVVSNTYKKGIPVILLSRRTEGDDYTTFIGPDNLIIAKQAAHVLGEKLQGKGRIVILEGISTSTTAIARTEGFIDGLSAYPGLSVVARKPANYLRAKAVIAVEELLKAGIQFDAIYAHSDGMATGARMALMKAGINPGSIPIVAIDYIKEAREAIRNGEQEATFTYPTGGKEGAKYAIDILNGQDVPKRILIPSIMVDKNNVEEVAPIF